jgi:hypothetical protein
VGAIGLGAIADPFGFRAAFGAAAGLCALAALPACGGAELRPGRRSGGRARRRPRSAAGRS